LRLDAPHAQSIVQEVCAALAGNPLAQAVSKLMLFEWGVDAPIAALHASFQNVLHFELSFCSQGMASSLTEVIAVWPMLQSVSLLEHANGLEATRQHLEAAAHTAAELKAGQPFQENLPCVFKLHNGDAERLDA